MKKFLSAFLCLVMVCVFMPAMAWAEGEAEIVQDIWVYNDAQAEGLTWKEMNSGQKMVEGIKVYLYHCMGETEQSPAVPFEAASAEGFHFYDADGNPVTEVPFSIDKEGDFWTVTCTGEVTANYILRYVETGEGGTVVHGNVSLEMLDSSDDGSGDSGDEPEETKYVNVKYKTDAIKTIGDFIYVTSELDVNGKLNRSYQLEVKETDTETGYTLAKSEWLQNNNQEGESGYNWYAIELNDGYCVDKILINGEESTNWWAELDYFYAMYDAEGKRLNTEDVELNYCGSISSEDAIAAWISYYFDGNEDGTPLLTETYIEDFNAALAEMKTVAVKTELLDTCVMYGVEVTGPDEDTIVEIVTKKLPVVTGSEVKAYDKAGVTVELFSDEKDVTDVQKDSLEAFYSEEKEIEKILDLNVEDTLTEAVEVVIPVANASDYEVVWFKDDNTPVPIATRYTEGNDGVVFTAGHFSLYALVKDADSSSGGSGSGSGSESGSGSGNGSGSGSSYIPPYNPAPVTPPALDDEAEKDTQKETEELAKAALVEAVKTAELNVKSRLVTLSSGKKAVKLTWENVSEVDFDGIEIFRSTKRYSGFGKKPIFTTENDCYYNTAIKAGTKYFYKVRGFVIVDGEKVYTDWSGKAWRTVK